MKLDHLTEDELDELKINEKPLGLCANWMQEIFRRSYNQMQNGTSILEIYNASSWEHVKSAPDEDRTYRLRHDWEKQSSNIFSAQEHVVNVFNCNHYCPHVPVELVKEQAVKHHNRNAFCGTVPKGEQQ